MDINGNQTQNTCKSGGIPRAIWIYSNKSGSRQSVSSCYIFHAMESSLEVRDEAILLEEICELELGLNIFAAAFDGAKLSMNIDHQQKATFG
jgi:hypothetical protein